MVSVLNTDAHMYALFSVILLTTIIDLVQGPSLVHYDSLRAFPSRSENVIFRLL